MRNIFAIVAIILCLTSNAQQFYGSYMPFGLGANLSISKDDALSPMSYSGVLGQMESGYLYQNKNWISSFSLSGSGGIQKPDVNRENHPSSTLSISARARYSLSYRITAIKSWQVFAGISSLNLWDYRGHERYSNSSFNFSGIFAAGPVFTAQREFKLFNKNWGFQYDLTVPVGSYVFRPSYIKPYFSNEIGYKSFEFWGDYFHLDSKAQLAYFLPNGNQLRLIYNWEYAQLNIPNKMQHARHSLVLSTLFKF